MVIKLDSETLFFSYFFLIGRGIAGVAAQTDVCMSVLLGCACARISVCVCVLS